VLLLDGIFRTSKFRTAATIAVFLCLAGTAVADEYQAKNPQGYADRTTIITDPEKGVFIADSDSLFAKKQMILEGPMSGLQTADYKDLGWHTSSSGHRYFVDYHPGGMSNVLLYEKADGKVIAINPQTRSAFQVPIRDKDQIEIWPEGAPAEPSKSDVLGHDDVVKMVASRMSGLDPNSSTTRGQDYIRYQGKDILVLYVGKKEKSPLGNSLSDIYLIREDGMVAYIKNQEVVPTDVHIRTLRPDSGTLIFRKYSEGKAGYFYIDLDHTGQTVLGKRAIQVDWKPAILPRMEGSVAVFDDSNSGVLAEEELAERKSNEKFRAMMSSFTETPPGVDSAKLPQTRADFRKVAAATLDSVQAEVGKTANVKIKIDNRKKLLDEVTNEFFSQRADEANLNALVAHMKRRYAGFIDYALKTRQISEGSTAVIHYNDFSLTRDSTRAGEVFRCPDVAATVKRALQKLSRNPPQ
jgi:hypothetical protein